MTTTPTKPCAICGKLFGPRKPGQLYRFSLTKTCGDRECAITLRARSDSVNYPNRKGRPAEHTLPMPVVARICGAPSPRAVRDWENATEAQRRLFAPEIRAYFVGQGA